MTTQLLTKTVDEKIHAEATHVIQDVHDRKIVGTRFVLDDGSEVALPQHLSALLEFVVEGLTQGGLSIKSLPDEMTTTSAAGALGVSRPTLMKLVADGNLPSHKVGSHHRFNIKDVLALKAERQGLQKTALSDLRELDLQLGIED